MSAPFSSPFIYYFVPASSEQRWALSEALADKQKLLLKFLLRCFPPVLLNQLSTCMKKLY